MLSHSWNSYICPNLPFGNSQLLILDFVSVEIHAQKYSRLLYFCLLHFCPRSKVWIPLLYLCLHGRFNEVTSLLFLFVSGRVGFQIWGATTAKWKDFSWQDVHFSRWTSTKYVHIGAVRPPFNRNVYSDLDSQNLVLYLILFCHIDMTVWQKKKHPDQNLFAMTSGSFVIVLKVR